MAPVEELEASDFMVKGLAGPECTRTEGAEVKIFLGDQM